MKDVSKPRLRQVFVKDISFEAPNVLKSMSEEWRPEVQLDINNKAVRLDEKTFEVTLVLTVAVKNAGALAYLCEIQQAGVFLTDNLEEDALKRAVGCYCPSDLFPYARATITSLASSGGFPNLVLAPVDFEKLYEKALSEQASAAENESGEAE